MATLAIRILRNVRTPNGLKQTSRSFHSGSFQRNTSQYVRNGLVTAGSLSAAYCAWNWLQHNAVVEAARPNNKRMKEEIALRGLKLNHRERRFIKFASVEFNGQLYMTPQDFIESVTDSEPRHRLKRRRLSEKDLDKFQQETPVLSKGSPDMFRNIYDKGIISYTEYLFLLSILTKPQTGFRIAFNMFDTDGNQHVDKEEFLVLEKIFSTARRDRLNRALEGSSPKGEKGDNEEEEEAEELEDELQKSHVVDTTLLVHFFGRKGKQDLRFEEFKMFVFRECGTTCMGSLDSLI